MKESPFNLSRQNHRVESRIVVALERISEAYRVLLWNESKENALSPIQIQILIFLLYHAREKCKVSYLAAEFNMTKATISDSVRVLLKKNLVEKFDDSSDSRSFTIGLTEAGREAAESSAHFASAIESPVHTLTDTQKEAMLAGLLKLIHDLHQTGVISLQRMCLTCANYRHQDGAHYCTLLESILQPQELRVDCPEHEMAAAQG